MASLFTTKLKLLFNRLNPNPGIDLPKSWDWNPYLSLKGFSKVQVN